MSENTTPTEDYTPSSQEWAQVSQVLNEITRLHHKLANSYRKYEADPGCKIDPSRELQIARDAMRKAIPDLASIVPDGSPSDVSVRDLVNSYWDQVKQRKNSAGTGFGRLNDILSGGIESQRLVTILGAPNTGKTTLAHQMADNIACSGRPVLYVTSEDTPGALNAKTLARIGDIPYTAVLKGWESERKRIDAALAMQMDRLSLDRLRYLDATNGATLDMIKEKAQEHFAQYTEANNGGPGLIVVDYLQRVARAIKTMGGMTQDLREVVTLVTERLRALSIELNCGVIAIAAQNRGSYTRGESGGLASAKESGDIEYTADVIISLAEDKDSKRVPPKGKIPIMLYVDKNRQGQKNKSVALDFGPDRQEFTEAEI